MSEPVVRLDRGPNGEIMCQLCFLFFPREQLHYLDENTVEDVCVPCWEYEQEMIYRKGCK